MESHWLSITMPCSWYSTKNAEAHLWLDQARAKACHHGWTSLSPFFFQLLHDHHACVLPLDESNVLNTAFLASFKNRTPSTMIYKISLHFCNGVCLLSKGIMPLVWCTLPHHGCKEKIIGILMVRKKKVMGDTFFWPHQNTKHCISQCMQYVFHVKWPFP